MTNHLLGYNNAPLCTRKKKGY